MAPFLQNQTQNLSQDLDRFSAGQVTGGWSHTGLPAGRLKSIGYYRMQVIPKTKNSTQRIEAIKGFTIYEPILKKRGIHRDPAIGLINSAKVVPVDT